MDKLDLLTVYNEYRKHTFYYERGFFPTAVKAVDNISDKSKLVFFEKFIDMVYNNAGMIDWKLYIKSLAKFYNGNFDPKLLTSLKGIKIYKTHVQLLNNSSDGNTIYDNVITSLRFVVDYCIESKIDFNGYLNENIELIPTLLKHYSAGSVSINFLVLVPNIKLIINNYPKDCVDEFMLGFLNEFESIRGKTIKNDKVRKIDKNLELVINKMIENGRL